MTQHSPATEPADYIFDSQWSRARERERLRHLEDTWDAESFANLEALGVASGWRCLEAGAGGGSIASWLAGRAAPQGHVVATDIDVHLLEPLAGPNLEVRRHDLVKDALEEGAFDLVHARLLLEHLPGRDEALRKLVAALKPGGVLLLEEFDHLTMLPDPACAPEDQDAWRRFRHAFEQLAAERGIDLIYGRRLYGLLAAHGLTHVSVRGRTQSVPGGAPPSRLLQLSLEPMREGLLATGAVGADDLEHLSRRLLEPGFSWTTMTIVAAIGRRPG